MFVIIGIKIIPMIAAKGNVKEIGTGKARIGIDEKIVYAVEKETVVIISCSRQSVQVIRRITENDVRVV